MSVRKKFRAIMAGKRLVLMPGAYDALSARIMEAEGFEAICAGGYAAIGSMLAQPDTGPIQYARLCRSLRPHRRRRRHSGLCRRRYRLRRREQCAADDSRLRGRGHRRRLYQRSGLPQPLRLPSGQAGGPGRANARQDQGGARRSARSGFLYCRPDRRRRRRRAQCGDRARRNCSSMPAPTWQSPWGSIPSTISSGSFAKWADRIWRRCRRRPGSSSAASQDMEAAGVVAATFPSLALFAAAQAVRNVLRILKRENSLTPDLRASAATRRLLCARRAKGAVGARGSL